jgi:hypothetical protein
MKFRDSIQSIKLLAKARRHIVLINHQLKTSTHEELLLKPFVCKCATNYSIKVIVKSYFWASRLLKNSHCLPRSIAIYQCLTSIGFEVEHKIGVAKKNENLAAHAWVEYQHKPLNESKDLKKRFKVLS